MFQLLDVKIQEFIKSGENLLMGAIGLHVERELAQLQRKWQQLKQQIVEANSIIEMTVKYFTLVEQVLLIQINFFFNSSIQVGLVC